MLQDEIRQLIDQAINIRTESDGIRKWKDIYIELGLDQYMTFNAFRTRIYREVKKELKDFNKTSVEDYKEITKSRDGINTIRRLLRTDARWELFEQDLINAINSLPPLPLLEHYPPLVCDHAKEGVLMLSDLHLGAACKNKNNVYDSKIATKRLSILERRVVEECKLNTVTKLNVCNLGDMIHGIIHTNMRFDEEFDLIHQISLAAEMVSEFLYNLHADLPGVEIIYRSVLDNHSRANGNKEESSENEQFSHTIDELIQWRLKGFDIDIRVWGRDSDNHPEEYLDPSVFSIKLRNGKKLIGQHGHLGGKNASMQQMVGYTREWIDYICMGHYHSNAEKDYEGCKVFINGSIVGTEQYALRQRLFTKPSQTLLIFNEDNNDIINIEICLDTEGN